MQMKGRLTVLLLITAQLAVQPSCTRQDSLPAHQLGVQEEIRNAIVLIPDGMSVAATTLARLYQEKPLALDPLACGLVSTWNADGTIADSAPAASAFATSWKSQPGNIATTGTDYTYPGVRRPAAMDFRRPVATILEAARLSGRSTGIISTSEFMHATPAAFCSHDLSRASYDNLTEQIIYNKLEVILGGGGKYLLPQNRQDQEDLTQVLASRGYGIVRNTKELFDFSGDRVLGVFGRSPNHSALSYDLDREPAIEPSLAEMTEKAISLLARNPQGFFLMVEGSKIDWAAHANDPLAMVTEILAFDRAVGAALDFARRDGKTMVLAMSDHGNSGISIGDRSSSKGYDRTSWTAFVNPLRKARVTGEGFAAQLPANRGEGMSATAIRALAGEMLGLDDLADAEVEAIAQAKDGQIQNVVGAIIAKRARIGFTTHGHTGEDVVLYAYHPHGRRPGGLVENADLALYLTKTLQVDLDTATAQLFQDATAAFQAKGAILREDTSDQENPVLIVSKGEQTLRLPRNKSIAYWNGMPVDSDGVTVFTGNRWFIARNLIDLIK